MLTKYTNGAVLRSGPTLHHLRSFAADCGPVLEFSVDRTPQWMSTAGKVVLQQHTCRLKVATVGDVQTYHIEVARCTPFNVAAAARAEESSTVYRLM